MGFQHWYKIESLNHKTIDISDHQYDFNKKNGGFTK